MDQENESLSSTGKTEGSICIANCVQQKEKHPYNLIVKEIWEKVFDWLTDPSDLASCLNTCSAFYNLLKDKRVMFMFPQVFKILADRTAKKKQDHVDLLTCRLISKMWQESVDTHYQNLPYFFSLDYHAFDEEALKCITAFLIRIWSDPFSTDFVLSPRGLPEMQRKLAVWRPCENKISTNPFPSRHLAIYDSEETLRDDVDGLLQNLEMKQSVAEMLTDFGHHVWYFTVLLHMGLPSQRYLLLLEWLKHAPNLKVLCLYFRAGDDDLEETVELNPFPELSQLIVFQGDKVPNVVVKSVLKSNPQLEKMQNQGAPSVSPFVQPQLAQERGQSEVIRVIDTARFSKLEKLSLDFHVASPKTVCFSSFDLHSCKSFEENGESGEIQVWRKSGESKGIFTMLKRFERTLVHFKLGILDNAPKKGVDSFSLNTACLNLILPLRSWSVKSLHVSWKCRDGYRWIDKKDVVSELHTYLVGRLEESKVWKLPEVKQIFVVDGCDGYLAIFV